MVFAFANSIAPFCQATGKRTGSVAVTVVWKWMYDNYTGILNFVLKGSGLIEKNINWLGDSKKWPSCSVSLKAVK